jgi:hypothetical protein
MFRVMVKAFVGAILYVSSSRHSIGESRQYLEVGNCIKVYEIAIGNHLFETSVVTYNSSDRQSRE